MELLWRIFQRHIAVYMPYSPNKHLFLARVRHTMTGFCLTHSKILRAFFISLIPHIEVITKFNRITSKILSLFPIKKFLSHVMSRNVFFWSLLLEQESAEYLFHTWYSCRSWCVVIWDWWFERKAGRYLPLSSLYHIRISFQRIFSFTTRDDSMVRRYNIQVSWLMNEGKKEEKGESEPDYTPGEVAELTSLS